MLRLLTTYCAWSVSCKELRNRMRRLLKIKGFSKWTRWPALFMPSYVAKSPSCLLHTNAALFYLPPFLLFVYEFFCFAWHVFYDAYNILWIVRDVNYCSICMFLTWINLLFRVLGKLKLKNLIFFAPYKMYFLHQNTMFQVTESSLHQSCNFKTSA